MEELWQIRPAFADAWFSDMFAKESETLTMALHRSFTSESSYDDDVLSAGMVELESLFAIPDVTPVTTPTGSGGSENETPLSKPRRRIGPSGKVMKRKSRASKRATTTFIAADPSNFRQMVQQVTGARFHGFDGQLQDAPLLKPEPHRLMTRLQPSGVLSAFDSSAFLPDTSGWSPLTSQVPPPSVPLAAASTAAPGPEFDSFCGFPTLESWKVM